MKKDLKKLRDIIKDDTNSQANVVKSVEDENDLFFGNKRSVLKTFMTSNASFQKTKNIPSLISHFQLHNKCKNCMVRNIFYFYTHVPLQSSVVTN